MNIEDISKSYLDFEITNKLFQRKIKDQNYWDFVRYPVFMEVFNVYKGKKKPYIFNKKQKNSTFKIPFVSMLSIFHLFKGILKIFLSKSKYDIIFYSTGGRKKIENNYVNPYCFYHLKSLSSSYKILVIETTKFNDRSFEKIDCDYVYIPLKSARLLSLLKPKGKANIEIEKLKIKFIDQLNIDIDIKPIIKNNYFTQITLNKIINKILNFTKPKIMGFVNDGNSKFFIKAAKDRNIPIFELQHGDVSKFDMVSSYPDKIDGDTWIQDQIYLFGDYWKDRYNINSKKISIGNPIFDKFKNKYALDKKLNQKIILCISVNSTDFAKFVFKASQKYQSGTFLFKLRDSEFKNWKKNYPFLKNTENFKVIANNHKHLYELIYESKYVISTISTVLYEALSLKKNVIIFKDDDFKYVEDLSRQRYARAVETINDLIMIIDSEPKNISFDRNFLYKPDCLNNFNVEIDKLIKK